MTKFTFSLMRRRLWSLGLAIALSNFAQCAATSKAVNVALQASFRSPPYLLELLETAAEENSTAYFPLIDRIAEGRFLDCTTDRDLYDTFLQVVQEDGHITDLEILSSFQFALSIHSAAPRIEAHYQYYDTSVEPNLMIAQDAACPVWVHFSGKQYCSPTLDRAQQDVNGLRTSGILPFDRVLGEGSDWPGPQSVLYADVTSPLFAHFHETLKSTARNGQTSYRIRYRPSIIGSTKPLVVNGYGVELALKRTDYIVIDDRAATDENPGDGSSVIDGEELVREDEELKDLKPLSSTDLLGLGLKAASFITASEDPFETLVKVSQDFPKHSHLMAKQNISEEFLAEHRKNRDVLLPSGYNIIFMNGQQIEARQMDAFALLEQFRRERSIIGSLRDLGFTGSEAVRILSHTAIAESKSSATLQRYDYRDTSEGGRVIIWLNDIEKDKRYADWPTQIAALLQRTFPGQMPMVRRDIHNVVIPVNLADVKDIEMLVETLQGFVKRKIPIRFGIVPLTNSELAMNQAKIFYHMVEVYGLGVALAYLQSSVQIDQVTLNQKNFESSISGQKLRNQTVELNFESILQSESLSDRIIQAKVYLGRLDAEGLSLPFFINGVALLRDDAWLQTMSSRVDFDLRIIQQQVFEGAISEDAWLAGQFLNEAATRRNAFIIPEDETSIRIFDVGNLKKQNGYIFERLPRITVRGTSIDYKSQMFIFADIESIEGRKLVCEAIDFAQARESVELLLVHNTLSGSSSGISSRIFDLALQHGYELDPVILKTALEATSESSGEARAEGGMAETFWESVQSFVKSVGLQKGQQGVLLNGRLLGPFPRGLSFSNHEFEIILQYERQKRLAPAQTVINDLGFQDRVDSPFAAAVVSSLIALSSISDIPEGIFESASSLRIGAFSQWETNHTVISTGDAETASIHLIASIDPISELAQRWIPMLKVLSDLNGVHLKLFLNPRERTQELPIKRFYRHVLDAKPSFEDDGNLHDLKASFEGLPNEALLNLALDVPPAWLVAPKDSIHDLDNIKLSTLKENANIDAVYELEHILIEGHSRDVTVGSPPRGVQLLLGTEKDPHFADTLIMANLGYFQFKANPGYWKIQLQPGRSEQIFKIDSAGQKGYSPQAGDESTQIALMSFQGKTLYPRLSRKHGQESEDVLEEVVKAGSPMDFATKASKFAASILSTVGLAAAPAQRQAEINIFSVASGHLYERMLNIMMVSVMRHTKHTVKFWFIEQFLSPSFKASLPHLASHYHFDYALVTYKWPHWLRRQTEKQREIWGYKILFLDVLFPLSLDKVIFVDADQIVRTDMYDLVTHNLHGAPYGFTPMCDSRTEMEGFRFWKQGYWKSFLRGLPYHISALYVVDLKRFRQLAAGDRLRQQYHQLSADPQSLSNLDQDLPNYMQAQLPIYSLPQEWLWCETWCSDESLAEARTIDLCNNPLTKEPKLDRARRQVPEWTAYDEEIAGVLRDIGNNAEKEEGADEGEKIEQSENSARLDHHGEGTTWIKEEL